MGVVLDVLDQNALAFYRSFDFFLPLTDNPMKLFVPVASLDRCRGYHGEPMSDQNLIGEKYEGLATIEARLAEFEQEKLRKPKHNSSTVIQYILT